MSGNYSGIRRFESRAKLMVTGEYSVLKGALSLALPLKFGQKLTVKLQEGEPVIYWQSLVKGLPWFMAAIQLPHFRVLDTNVPGLSKTLCRILRAAKELNPKFLAPDHTFRVISEMDFDPAWGLGSSSSLLSNIAYWAGCDPFLLNRNLFGGSGYDIACARSRFPIIYQTENYSPACREASFNPPFHRNLHFVYLGRKQDTRHSISELKLENISSGVTDAISAVTLAMEKATDLADFQSLMNRHEELTGELIRRVPVRESMFADFPGAIKSLGAWGGDFILAASGASDDFVRNYFIQNNLQTVFNYNEIVLAGEYADCDPLYSGRKSLTLKGQNV